MINFENGFVSYLTRLADRGGPTPNDYAELDDRLFHAHKVIATGKVPLNSITEKIRASRVFATPESIQGHGLLKPYGYSGDFEIIDRIYTNWLSPRQELVSWDRYFHAQAAPRAVRNRKEYFKRLLDRVVSTGGSKVLKLGVGPGRCMREWLDDNPDAQVHFDCVDIDASAIKYARKLNAAYLDKISFRQCNALRFRPATSYDLIWAAGLFDYFSDRIFISLCKRLWPAVAPGGELVVGNFDAGNPSRAYMEILGDWHLCHRSPSTLRALMIKGGVPPSCIRIGIEPEGVNLFVHAYKEQ